MMTQLTKYLRTADRAVASMGLRPISFSEVMALSPQQAHTRLAPYFADLPALPTTGKQAVWFRTLQGMRSNWLGSNQKLDKEATDLAIKLPYSVQISGISLSPSDDSGVANVCPLATAGCRTACIGNTGQFSFSYSRAARIAKTRALIGDPVAWLRMLVIAIARASHNARRKDQGVGIRLNILSDVPWEIVAPWLFSYFSGDSWRVHFYDYSKIPGRVTPTNYRITFSQSGHNDRHVEAEIARGTSIAVVFADKLPATYRGLPVIDGDLHDFRAGDPEGVIVGLKWKSPLTGGVRRESVGKFVVWPEDRPTKRVTAARRLPVALELRA